MTKTCKHLRSKIRGTDPYMKVFCLDCGKVVFLTEVVTNFVAEMEEFRKLLKENTKVLEKKKT